MPEGASASSGIGSFLKDVFHSIGLYWMLAAIIVVLAVYKFSSNVRELRKCIVTIVLFRQTKPLVNASTEERKESVDKRIEAVRAIEDESPLSDDDETQDER